MSHTRNRRRGNDQTGEEDSLLEEEEEDSDILRHPIIVSTLEGGIMLVVPSVASIAHLICLCIDAAIWTGSKMPEKVKVCLGEGGAMEEPAYITAVCDSFDADLGILMKLYTFATGTLVGKFVLLLVFVTAHHAKNTPIIATFDIHTLLRGYSGIAAWSMVLAMDTVSAASVVYRYMVLPFSVADYEETLYPETADDTGGVLMVFTVTAMLCGVGLTATILGIRATELRSAVAAKVVRETKTQVEVEMEKAKVAHAANPDMDPFEIIDDGTQ